MSAIPAILGGAFLIAFAWFWLGWFSGRKKERNLWWNEMIRRRHALYHWENGKVYWNEDEPPTPRDPAATKIAQQQTKILGRVETSF